MTFNPKSFAGIALTARGLAMAMAGKSAVEISTTLNIPLLAARYWGEGRVM